ncbi:hypothetical protein BDC45DRAFT_564145 [Circinella umbellata]|nr:hypothetical protein BDC45DRAFT_564145 [Circinella umbellata]
MQAIINKHLKTITSSTSPTSASFKTSNLSLSQEDRDSIHQTYMSMDPHKKWEIEPGVSVEDRIYEYGKTQNHEHASHSFILDLGDNDIDELRNIAENARFHATEEFDADWCRRCILDILCAYRWGVVKRIARHGKEKDLIMRVYRAIDLAFDDLWADVQRSDQLSSASSARMNKDRRALDGSLQRKILGTKPDMIITKNMVEYGLAEHGYDDEAGVGSKELVERFIKLPKTMKDMLVRLASEISNEEYKIRQLKVVGFSHTHTRVTGMIMNVPAGYVCRVKPLK